MKLKKTELSNKKIRYKKLVDKRNEMIDKINKLKEKLEAPMVQARYQYAIDVMLTRLRMIDADLTGKNERPLIRNLCSVVILELEYSCSIILSALSYTISVLSYCSLSTALPMHFFKSFEAILYVSSSAILILGCL